jgi:hypothetical protein
MQIQFDGQQEGERILFTIQPHATVKHLAIAKTAIIAAVFFIIGVITGLFLPGLLIAALILTIGIWWNTKVFADTHAYVTDRRIMRFERVSPFLVTKRALFWNEVMKAKVYQPNLVLQKLNIGTLVIEPQVSTEANVIVEHIHYAEDLANYIDKILYTFKNTPNELSAIRPFVPKPKGQRD